MSGELLNPRGVFHFEETAIAPRLRSLDRKHWAFTMLDGRLPVLG